MKLSIVIGNVLLLCIFAQSIGGCEMANSNSGSGLKRAEGEDQRYVKGIIVVGFKKGVSRESAESVLKKYNIKFENTPFPNQGKKFFYETGEKYSVQVPAGEEMRWIEKLEKEEKVAVVEGAYNPGLDID
jgi:hypothetical protein